MLWVLTFQCHFHSLHFLLLFSSSKLPTLAYIRLNPFSLLFNPKCLEQGHCNCPRRHRATNAPPEAPPSDPRVVRGGRVGAWCLRGASAAPAPWEGGDFPVLPWDTHSPRNPPSLHSLGLPLPAAQHIKYPCTFYFKLFAF